MPFSNSLVSARHWSLHWEILFDLKSQVFSLRKQISRMFSIVFGRVFKLMGNHKSINWALADQSMVSGVNFCTGVILARFLGLEEFGMFTLAWTIILFVHGLQLAVIVSPMMTIGAKQSEEFASGYFGAMFTQALIFSVLMFSSIVLAALLIDIYLPAWQLADIAFVLALAGTGFLFQDFIRRYLFTRQKAHLAFLNDAISYISQLVLLLWCFNNIEMNSSRVFLILGITSGMAILASIGNFPSLVLDRKILRKVMSRNWRFARWLSASSIVQWLSGHLFLIAAGSFLGVAVVGAMKSAQNILGVSHILFQGFENIVPIQASRKLKLSGEKAAKLYMQKLASVGMLGTISIATIFGIAPDYWMRLFYGEQFVSYSYLLVWYAFIYPVVFLSLMLRIWLRTLERTQVIFTAYVLMVITGVGLVYPLAKMYEVQGVMFGILATNIVMVFILVFFLRVMLKGVKTNEY